MKKLTVSLVILAALCLALAGCASLSHLTYDHAEKYSGGEAQIASPVEALDIHWLDGGVTVAYHDESTVLLTETARRPLSEKEQLRWYLDGGTLRVQYAAAGSHSFNNLQKRLTVTLPRDTVLASASISLTSGQIDADRLCAKDIELQATSGSVRAGSAADTLKILATSGNIDLTAAANQIQLGVTSGHISARIEQAEELKIDATSGRVSAEIQRADRVKIGSTSGNIDCTVLKAGVCDINSTSGRVDAHLKGVPEKTSVNTTSGAVNVYVPATAGVRMSLGAVSSAKGRVSLGLPVEGRDGEYLLGDGGAALTVSTVSGNITVSEEKN